MIRAQILYKESHIDRALRPDKKVFKTQLGMSASIDVSHESGDTRIDLANCFEFGKKSYLDPTLTLDVSDSGIICDAYAGVCEEEDTEENPIDFMPAMLNAVGNAKANKRGLLFRYWIIPSHFDPISPRGGHMAPLVEIAPEQKMGPGRGPGF